MLCALRGKDIHASRGYGGKPCAGDRAVLNWQPIPNAALYHDLILMMLMLCREVSVSVCFAMFNSLGLS